MDFQLTAEQEEVRRTFHEFAAREIRPEAARLDRDRAFPERLFAKAGELGFFAMRYPPPEGLGADRLSFLLAVEELAWGSLAVAAACTMQALMGSFFVHRFAEGKLRDEFVPALFDGRLKGTICMTEPDAGSDLFAMRTAAEERDGVWVLNGRKTWITSAPVADLFTVFARTGEKELSIFLVERGAPGLRVGRSIEKMGVRASLTSELEFEDCEARCLLGPKGGGVAALREVLAEIRLMTAALALGIARAAYEEALRYANERRQFGRPIGAFQAVRMHVAEMGTSLEAARRLVHWAAWAVERGDGAATAASQAKLFASETAAAVCDRAARVFASYGFAEEYPVERYLRDVRFLLIGGGTSEILKVNIGKALLER